MSITLDQARALVEIIERGGFVKAAENLHKSHTALIYAISNLEKNLGMKLLNRKGYRTKLTESGQRVFEQCKKILNEEGNLYSLCNAIKTGKEPYLRIVMDGILPIKPIISTLGGLIKVNTETRISFATEYLKDVEKNFHTESCDIMMGVLPVKNKSLEPIPLKPIDALLVARKNNQAFSTGKEITQGDLENCPLLTVRGADPTLNLSTQNLNFRYVFYLNDFHSKKIALMENLGIGWMPSYMIQKELDLGVLKVLAWTKSSSHSYIPFLYHHGKNKLGLVGTEFLKQYLANQ